MAKLTTSDRVRAYRKAASERLCRRRYVEQMLVCGYRYPHESIQVRMPELQARIDHRIAVYAEQAERGELDFEARDLARMPLTLC